MRRRTRTIDERWLEMRGTAPQQSGVGNSSALGTSTILTVATQSHYTGASHAVRGGFTIIEMIGTCALLGVLFAITVPMFTLIAQERRSTEQRQFALQHATNLLEQATTRSWADLVPGELTVPDADADLTAVLPGLERSLLVKQIDGEPESRQIVASVRWLGRPGQSVSPIQISAWVYPTKEANR